jgi:hypothetical protein
VEQNVKANIKDPSKVHIIPGPFHALAVMPDTDKFFRENNPGKWFFHCHTGNHLKMGMQATYVVERDRPKTTTN